jgi:protein-tyrosine phosphatase
MLEEQPQAVVLIHCTAGRRRSAMLVYAVLRLRGHDQTAAAELVLCPRSCRDEDATRRVVQPEPDILFLASYPYAAPVG